MRGAYIARLDLDQPHHSGVALKMASQCAALKAALGPVDLIALAGNRLSVNGAPTGPALRRTALRLGGFYRAAAPRLAGADYLYIRYQRASPALLWLLRGFRRAHPGAPVFIEIPTWPYTGEAVGARDKVLGAMDRACRGRLAPHVDRIVTFSRETAILGIPTICTDNGVDPAALPLARPGAVEGPLRLVAVANLGLRHAYDRVIAGLAAYDGARDVVFDIIGSGVSEPDLRAAAAGLEGRVRFLGPKMGADLDAALDGAHLGVAALGMHRIAAATSDIKSREYCARGLPFVTSNADADFPDGSPFALQIPADDSPVDIAALVAFHAALPEDTPARMRAYAETRLSWRAKLAPVVTALQGAG